MVNLDTLERSKEPFGQALPAYTKPIEMKPVCAAKTRYKDRFLR